MKQHLDRTSELQPIRWGMIGLASAIFLSTVTEGVAADSKTFNLHCLENFAMLASSSEGAAKTSATLGLIYFLGRLDDQSPGFDIAAELEGLVRTDTTSAAQEDMDRCKAELGERGQALVAAGDVLQKLAARPPK